MFKLISKLFGRKKEAIKVDTKTIEQKTQKKKPSEKRPYEKKAPHTINFRVRGTTPLVDSIPQGVKKILADHKITTMEELRSYRNRVGLEKLRGIGEVRVKALAKVLNKFNMRLKTEEVKPEATELTTEQTVQSYPTKLLRLRRPIAQTTQTENIHQNA